MPPEEDSRKSLIDSIADQYLVDDETDNLTYGPEGLETVEAAYKAESRFVFEELRKEYREVPLIEVVALVRLRNEIIDTYNHIEEFVEESESDLKANPEAIGGKTEYDDQQIEEEIEIVRDLLFRLETSDNVLLLFTLSSETVKSLLANIIENQIFTDERVETSDVDSHKVAKEIDFRTKVNLVYFTGIIDKALRDDLINIRKTRNRLLHNKEDRHYLESLTDPESIINIVEQSIDAIDKLHEDVYGYRPAFDSESEKKTE